MGSMIGTVLPGGTRIDAQLEYGTWELFRGSGPDGTSVLVTTVPQPPPTPSPPVVARELALPFDGIPRLLGVVDVASPYPCRALIEEAPAGTRVSELGAVAVTDALTVGLDLARLLATMHAAGALHGDLRPQTTFVARIGDRLTLTGTSPRCSRFGAPYMPPTKTGWYSPFLRDSFLPDVMVRGDQPSTASDVAQLGMIIERLVTGRSPFATRPDESVFGPLMRAMQGDSEPWNLDAPLARELEALAKATFHPTSGPTRALAPLHTFLERATA